VTLYFLRTLTTMLSRRLLPSLLLSPLFYFSATLRVSALAQSASAACTQTAHAIVFYAPETNLERNELETLKRAKFSVDVAMYSFTDHELAEELVLLARSGVRVRVYRDAHESSEENQRGASTTAILLGGEWRSG